MVYVAFAEPVIWEYDGVHNTGLRWPLVSWRSYVSVDHRSDAQDF